MDAAIEEIELVSVAALEAGGQDTGARVHGTLTTFAQLLADDPARHASC